MTAMNGQSPTRSVRIDTETWDSAKKRAEGDGVSISRALNLLTQGYARGMINLPKVKIIYDTND